MKGQWLFHLLILLLLCFNLNALDAAEDKIEKNDEDEITVQKWRETFALMKKWIGGSVKLAMPLFMESMSDKNLHLSQQCRRALFQWISDIKATKPWALEMIDASAKLIDGIFSGSFTALGSFDQCLNVVNPKKTLQGKYCTVEVWPHLPPKPRFYAINQRLKAFRRFENDTSMMGEFTKYLQLFYMFPLRWGICIPSPCSELDLSNVTSHVSKHFRELNITVPRCEIKEPTKLENYQIPILCVISMLLFFVIFGTFYDIFVYRKNKDNEPADDAGVLSEVIIAFSAPRNFNKLMNLESGAESLSVLHGIRFISMCWIILGHTFFHLNFNILRHLQITIELTSEFIFNAITNANLVVDTFFFISGLLLIYVTIDMKKKMGKMPNAFYFIIHRLWRFWPIMMFFVGCCTLLPLFSSGPIWHENIDPIVYGCKRDWWANMIFINNLYRSTDRGCLSYSWYLAADFQIYLFCIPIVTLIIRKPRLGLWINFVVMLLSVIAVAAHNYVRDLPPAMLYTRADIQQRIELMRETYYTPYRHVGPCCIGLFVGYYLQTNKEPIKLHWSLNLTAWMGSFLMTSAALFGVHPWNQGSGGTGRIASMLYASLSRIAWTLGVAWVTIACSKGCGGIVAKILRSKICVPFSRLTFLVYMVHPLVQYVFYATLRDGLQALNHLASCYGATIAGTMIWRTYGSTTASTFGVKVLHLMFFTCCGFIIASYAIALVLALLLESPFISLGVVIFKRREGPKKTDHDNCKDFLPVKSKSHAEVTPGFVNGYAKCNGAYEPHPEIAKYSGSAPTEHVSSGEEFICHL